MKKGLIIALALVVILVIVGISSYNSMVNKQEAVHSAYANIETQLRRRADLIPNLVNTVKGYMTHEQNAIDSITASREKLLGANSVSELAEAGTALDAAVKNLLVLVENYPDLKANTNFIQLQDELAGTENRVATARRDYNTAVEAYNKTVKRFPGKLLAGIFGFEPAPYFETSAESKEVPNVSF